ncbi:MAG: hypothetical protein PHQ28_05000 [Mycobacterium sp.]|nr:hypothetical protein [Mycobacterium sp.]
MSGLIEKATAATTGTPPAPPASPPSGLAAVPSQRPPGSPQAAAAEAAPASSTKKQVNYRLGEDIINDLKKASIVYSYRQQRQVSQNQIVETAVREWLDANGPWVM